LGIVPWDSSPDLRLGASFSPRRAVSRGLDWRLAFQRLLEMPLSPIRLSAYWDAIDRAGHCDLEWLLSAAEAAGRGVILSAGMKAQGWPEFYIPDRLVPAAAPGATLAAGYPALAEGALAFVAATVERYRRNPTIVAWQVENEPLNPSGPQGWRIGSELVRHEIAAVRELDRVRPIVLNVFCRFNRWRLRKGPQPEVETLALLQPGDVLGLDVYRRIGGQRLGVARVRRNWGWRRTAGQCSRAAGASDVRTWAIEAQAEPWRGPGTCRPGDLATTVDGLRAAGCTTILLWGTEHWLARDMAGDPTWLEAVAELSAGGAGPGRLGERRPAS
jgi:hypothetical protein